MPDPQPESEYSGSWRPGWTLADGRRLTLPGELLGEDDPNDDEDDDE